PEAIVRYINHSYVSQDREEAPPSPDIPDPMSAVIALLRTRAKFDFSHYKRGTISRRIHRRMSVRHLHQISEYVQVLRRDPAEVPALYKDLLINVSSFFREPASWEVLREHVLAPLVRNKDEDGPIRVWVPGCATGEEAYSIAMMLIEEMTSQG